MNAPRVHWNGTLQPETSALVPARDLAFLAGDGVFETVWVTRGVPVFLREHLERLEQGLAQLQIPPPGTPAQLAAWVRELIAERQDCAAAGRLRITVSAGAGGPGVRRHGKPNWLITLEPWIPVPAVAYEQGVGIEQSRHRRAPHPLQTVKSTSYAGSLWQRREAQDPTTFDVVQSNTEGNLAEGSFTNVFVVDPEGVLRTPAPEDGCLPGITRRVVLELARAAAIRCQEGAVPAAALGAAREVFLTGSLCGIVPVRRVDGTVRAPGAPGTMTRRLMAAYAARVREDCRDHAIGVVNDG